MPTLLEVSPPLLHLHTSRFVTALGSIFVFTTTIVTSCLHLGGDPVIRGAMVVKSITEKAINEGAAAREASREFGLKSVVLRQVSCAEQSH
jgi:hypothetical protein